MRPTIAGVRDGNNKKAFSSMKGSSSDGGFINVIADVEVLEKLLEKLMD